MEFDDNKVSYGMHKMKWQITSNNLEVPPYTPTNHRIPHMHWDMRHYWELRYWRKKTN